MATVAESSPNDLAAPAPKPKRLVIVLLVAVVLLGGGAAAWLLLQPRPAGTGAAGKEAAATTAEPIYLSMMPSFVVNLDDDEAMRYLQVDMELMARDQKVIDAAKNHMPLLRNNILLLFGSKRYHQLVSRADKEQLQAETLAEVQKLLKEKAGAVGVEAVYFTAFVMQ